MVKSLRPFGLTRLSHAFSPAFIVGSQSESDLNPNPDLHPDPDRDPNPDPDPDPDPKAAK